MSSPRFLLLSRVLSRAVSPVLARELGPPAMALGMGLVWMLQALPLVEMKRAAAAQSPAAAAATLGGFALAQALLMRHALRMAWRSPAVDLLDRQPLPWTDWSLALVPMALSLATPAAFVALLWPWRAPLLGFAAVLGLASVLVFAQARPDAGRWVWSAGVLGAGGALVAAARAWPGLEAPLGLLALGGGFALLGPARLAGARRVAEESVPADVRPNGPRAALVMRDALALWCLDRGLVLGSTLGLALPAALLGALGDNGSWSGPELEEAALVLMALASPLLAMGISQLTERLGTRLDVPEWPVGPETRALTLCALPALWSLGAVTALVLAAPGALLPWGAARLAGLACGLCGLASAMAVWTLPPRVNMGVWCGGAAALAFGMVLTGRPGIAVGAALGLGLLFAAGRRLDEQRRTRT